MTTSDLIYNLAVTPYSQYGFAARMSGLYETRDGGITWQSLYNTLGLTEPLPTLAVAVSPDFFHNPCIFAGVNGGILRSTDGGHYWERVFAPDPLPTVTCLCLSPNFADTGMLFAGTLEDGIFLSRDQGQTWKSANFGLIDKAVYSLSLSPGFAEDGLIFAGTHSGIFRSTNQGESWHPVELPDGYSSVLSLALSPQFLHDRVLFAGTEAHGLLRSSDAGRLWVSVGSGLTQAVNSIVVSANFPQPPELLVVHGDELLRSDDGGVTWQSWKFGGRVSTISAPQGFCHGQELWIGQPDGNIIVT